MRNAAIQTLAALIEEGCDIHFFTGDLGFKVLDDLRTRHPRRFTNAGVSEANMVSVAAGLAATGKRVFCYSMAPFVFLRAFEQVRLDLCAQHLPVTLIGVGGGLSYGCEGPSHYAIEDLAVARSLPGLTVYCPGDPHECRAAVRAAAQAPGPVYLRLGKNNDPAVHAGPVTEISRLLPIIHGAPDVCVLATGHILHAAAEAARAPAPDGPAVRLFSAPALKPFDEPGLRAAAAGARAIATIEEHSLIGGLGSLVAECLFGWGYRGRFLKIGLPDEFCNVVGDHDHLRRHYGLDAPGLARRLRQFLQEGESR